MATDKPRDGAQNATPQQMALGLFEDMLDLGLPISDAPREIGYQRHNFFTEISNVGLPARRFLDAAYFLIAQGPEERDFHDIELNYFKWLMRYDSRNLRHLRSIADEAQNAKIRITNTPPGREPTDQDLWVSVQLMGTVGFHRGRIRYRVPPELLPHIRDPQKSHWLSLRISTAFTRSLGRAIYDRIIASVSVGRTDWIPLDEMRSWPGKMGANAAIFKYFKRDWLEPAVREINEVSDIDVRYETRTASSSSKKIDRIRFLLKRKDTADAVMASLTDASEIYKTLKTEFNLSTAQFSEISEHRTTWTDERIQHAIEYTRFRLEQGKVTKSPAGFLMRALKDNWAISEAERKMVVVQGQLAATERATEAAAAPVNSAAQASAAARDDMLRQRMSEEVRVGRELFENADEKARRDYVRSFVSSPFAGRLMLRRLKLEASDVSDANIMSIHPDLANSFCQFVLAKHKKDSS